MNSSKKKLATITYKFMRTMISYTSSYSIFYVVLLELGVLHPKQTPISNMIVLYSNNLNPITVYVIWQNINLTQYLTLS